MPGRIGWPGATISSPVEMIATSGRRHTSTAAAPTAASMPISREVSTWPARSTVSPRARSLPAKAMNWPETAGRRTAIAGTPPSPPSPTPSTVSVCSTMTTASAPRGAMPPVAIRVAVPGLTVRRGAVPGVRISGFSTRIAGDRSLAPMVSSARTAKPSTPARSNPGTSISAATVRASTRPRACANGTVSVPSG